MSEIPVVTFWERSPPYAVAAAVRLAGLQVEVKPDATATKDTPVQMKFANGQVLSGTPMILKYVARAAGPGAPRLYGADPLAACAVDEWIDFAAKSFVSGPGLDAAAAAAAAALALQTVLVGHGITIADLAAWDALLNAGMWVKVRKQPAAANLLRWFEFCSAAPVLRDVLAEMGPRGAKARASGQTPTTSGKAAKQAETGSFDINLPGAKKGAVVTRFPPEPSGYLHIGHAKAALLNQHIADMYEGTLLVRFDDTNPSKESTEFVDNIIEDMDRLGLRYKQPISYTSDFFEPMVALAKKMIAAGMMYGDNTDVETMRAERLACTESRCRGASPEETARVFEEMLAGSEEGKTYCLRIKLDMSNANACLRDPVAYRCNDHPHWRTGTKFKTYPTYDFACPYVDAVQGVTHALRTSEYKDREEQFYRILKLMQQIDSSIPSVHIWDYSRLNFVHTVLSKRKLQKLVDTGVVSCWTDPRFPTVQGVLRRGMTLEALKEFIISQGASKNTTLQEWDKIWSINKRMIDPVCPRHTGLVKAGLVPVAIAGGPAGVEVTTVPKHKKNPDVGTKALYQSSSIFIEQADAALLEEGVEVTLMDWGNCIVKAVRRGADGSVEAVEGQLHLEGDFKKTKLKLTWLADVPDVVPLRLVDFDHLITKAKLEEEDVFEDFVNHNTWQEQAAIGDANMRALQKGDIIQLERKGFYKVDEAATQAGKALLLYAIPDGRQKK